MPSPAWKKKALPSVVVTTLLPVVGATGLALMFSVAVALEALHSFPTRRSSDLGLPTPPVAGVNTSLPALMLAAETTWPAVTAVPLSVSTPLPGRLVMIGSGHV